MREFATFFSVLLVGLFFGHPIYASTSDSEKLQNKVNSFQEHLEDYADALDEANSNTFDSDAEDDEDYLLAILKYDDALPLFESALDEIRSAKTVTRYIKGIDKKQRKELRTTLHTMYAKLATEKRNMEAAFAQEDSSAILRAVESAISDGESTLRSNKSSWHDALELYIRGHAEMMFDDHEDTSTKLDETYDLYREAFGEGAISVFLDYYNNFASYYAEGVALLQKGNDSNETRDLQLLNRAIKKFLLARNWAAQIHTLLSSLETEL